MATPTVTTPDFTGTVDARVFLAALGGPEHPISYLDRFPDEVYTKAIDSRLVRFMYTLLGPAGIGWLRKNYLDARLALEDYGIEVFDLDKFYGNPFQFPRILEEVYESDPSGLLSRTDWETIRAKDASYRNRAIDFVNAARAGGTPLGMHLAARSGLGHEVEIIENYKWFYDQKSDDPLGLKKYGFTNSTNEFVVVPRQELPQNEVQVLKITGTPTGGTFKLFLPLGNTSSYQTAGIAYNATRFVVQAALELLPGVAKNVIVDGGPFPDTDVRVTFTGSMSNTDIPQLQADPALLTGGTAPTMVITTELEGKSATDEILSIAPRDQYSMRQAMDRLRPVGALMSFNKGNGLTSRQVWAQTTATSTYREVLRYVTGNTNVAWPTRDTLHWIESNVEHQALRSRTDLAHHYQGFHNIVNLLGYTEAAAALTTVPDLVNNPDLASNHIGPFSAYQVAIFPFLGAPADSNLVYTTDRAAVDYVEPLTVTANSSNASPLGLINGMYPMDYQGLPGVQPVKYKEDQFWASLERTTGDEYLEIDLGSAQAVNYLYFEVSDKPFNIEVYYDVLDQSPERSFVLVTDDPDVSSVKSIGYRPMGTNPWNIGEYHFTDAIDSMIYTRFLRVRFTRRQNAVFTLDNGTLMPYSVEVRNLRVGRNVV